MNSISLFVDSSVNPQLKIGVGAYLIVEDFSFKSTEQSVKTKIFENTSSTTLELQTLLWALESLNKELGKLTIYTDCQNIMGLEKRCEAFEKNGYVTRAVKPVRHAELYRLFYQKIKTLECKFIKVKGHKQKAKKDEIDTIFTYVDTVSRKCLRELIKPTV
ncbi:MAG: RNase H family protein [Arcobacteraceae bacterium]